MLVDNQNIQIALFVAGKSHFFYGSHLFFFLFRSSSLTEIGYYHNNYCESTQIVKEVISVSIIYILTEVEKLCNTVTYHAYTFQHSMENICLFLCNYTG